MIPEQIKWIGTMMEILSDAGLASEGLLKQRSMPRISARLATRRTRNYKRKARWAI